MNFSGTSRDRKTNFLTTRSRPHSLSVLRDSISRMECTSSLFSIWRPLAGQISVDFSHRQRLKIGSFNTSCTIEYDSFFTVYNYSNNVTFYILTHLYIEYSIKQNCKTVQKKIKVFPLIRRIYLLDP